MIDYLEELLDNAGALLEQVRRMEQNLSVLEKNDGNVTENGASELGNKNISENCNKVYSLEKLVNQPAELVDKSDLDGEIQGGGQKLIANRIERDGYDSGPDMGERKRAEQEGRRETVPALAVQLERLDRAVSSGAGQEARGVRERGGWKSLSRPGSRPEREYFPMSGAPGAGREGMGAVPSPRADGGERLWAEEADRAFRRDSRRYDGGFYLY